MSGAVITMPAFAEKVKPRSGRVPTAAERPNEDRPGAAPKLPAVLSIPFELLLADQVAFPTCS